MKNENSPTTTLVLEQFPRLRRTKFREVSSRFQSPTSPSSPSFDHVGNQSPVHTVSPVRRRPNKNRVEDSASLRGLWPSSSSTLGDQLGHDRIIDNLERNRNIIAKENHRPSIIGGSARYTKSSSLTSPNNKLFNTSDEDVNALLLKQSSRRASDTFNELGDACSSAYSKAKKRGGVEVASKYLNDVLRHHRRGTSSSDLNAERSSAAAQKVMKRASSLTSSSGTYGSSKTQWALSPGRSDSVPRLPVEGKAASFSNLKPLSSPSRTTSKSRSVEKLFSFGLDFFKSKKSSSSLSPLSSNSVSEASQEFRLLHNRLIQWRFANARADCVNVNVANLVESNLICAWFGLTKLQHSVVQKKIQFQKEKLQMKLNFILQSQFNLLENWGDMERQYLAALSMTKESLHSVVCRVPLIEGAKVDIQSARITVRQASDLASSIKLMVTTFLPAAEKNVELMSELAKVVAQEKLVLEECLELLRVISILEIEERSLKCGIITQMGFWQKLQKHGQEISS